MTTISVCIPSIPPRAALLASALNSVCVQSRPVDEICVVVDHQREGATSTRNRAWRMSTSHWVAFLDDDDEFNVDHIERLLACALEHDADMVYSWFDVIGGVDPFPPTHFTEPWDPANPRQTTITCLWRRDALEKIGGFPEPPVNADDPEGNRIGEDYLAVLALNDAGGKIVHLAERTWRWRHHGLGRAGIDGNTSGRGDRW